MQFRVERRLDLLGYNDLTRKAHKRL